MKGIDVPDRTEDFTADPVELFFDLAFVFAFSQLVGHLVHHPTWTGVGEAALLFWLMWLPWSQFTWAANTVSGNGRAVRAIFIVGTAVSVPMAASVSTAYDEGGKIFAVFLAAILVLGIATLWLGVRSAGMLNRTVTMWAGPGLVTIALIVLGGFAEGSTRVGLWIAATISILIAMGIAGTNEWVIRPGHFAERHGLIVIIALGEVIVAIGVPVVEALSDNEGLPGTTAAALAGAGAFAGLVWWAYFDRVSPALEHRAMGLEDDLEKGRYARDVYTGAHAPVVGGIILSAAALEEIALHPDDHVGDPFRAMFLGGLVLLTLGVTAGVWRAFRIVPRERLLAIVVIALAILISSNWNGWVVILVIDAILAATLVAEHFRIER